MSLVLYNLATSVGLVVDVFYIILLVRVVASFFPPRQAGIWATLAGLAERLSDPVLMPIRQRLPLWGGLDFSPLIALLLVNLVGNVVSSGLMWLALHV